MLIIASIASHIACAKLNDNVNKIFADDLIQISHFIRAKIYK